MLALEFPPVSHLVEWPTLWGSEAWGGGWLTVNKVVLLFIFGLILVSALFLAGSKRALIPTGIQNVCEMAVEFIEDNIVLQTMGRDGLPFAPFLLTIFTFILGLNLIGLIPVVQMPANARMALPLFLALLVWVVFNGVGMIKQGPLKYLKAVAIPPGVPAFILPLVMIIELVSTFLIRPLSQSIRLFANLLAGHLILVSFAVLSGALFEATKIGFVLPWAMLILLTGFELLVAVLQAYIFTILSAVYIGGALHPHH